MQIIWSKYRFKEITSLWETQLSLFSPIFLPNKCSLAVETSIWSNTLGNSPHVSLSDRYCATAEYCQKIETIESQPSTPDQHTKFAQS